MELAMKAIEMTGTVDEQGHLHLDEPLTVPASSRVRIILLFPEEADIDEHEWLRGATSNSAFDFLKDPEPIGVLVCRHEGRLNGQGTLGRRVFNDDGNDFFRENPS